MKAHWRLILAFSLIGVAIAAASFYAWQIYSAEKAAFREEVAAREHDIAGLEEALESVRAELGRVQQEKSDLAQTLAAEQTKNQVFESQIKDLSTTVGSLQKLSTIDPELLKKYSKVYFLSENYVPANLSAIGQQYIYNKNKPQLIHSGVYPYIQSLLAVAEQGGMNLRVISGYRSFYEQSGLKSAYSVTYGSGANQFSADQGYSEHQLGTAVDFTTTVLGENFAQFKGTAAYKWLEDNAWRYGFVLSYPEGNQYYVFEPWHWRFVGVALATKLHNTSQYFYNLTQREIDEYLISFFD